jgi:adenine-specific DNA-methyltransferase
LCYAKSQADLRQSLNKLALTEEQIAQFCNPDDDPRGPWVSSDFTAQGYRPNQMYEITTPAGKKYSPPEGRCWIFTETAFKKYLEEGRMWFGVDGTGVPRRKTYLSEREGSVPWTWWTNGDVGHSQEAKKEIIDLFGASKAFDTPKPVRLIRRIMEIASDEDSIILDSFAGSGTTMHAVMDLNKEDGGKRKCILVQMSEASEKEPKKNICKDITRERVKRAIEKYGYDSGFQYCKVGIPLDAETLLSGNLPTYKQFAEYVYYLCTGESLKNKKDVDEKSYFVAEHGASVIYLVYKRDFDELCRMALNLTIAEDIRKKHPKKRAIVYAPSCFLDEEYMKDMNIDYVGIPYSLFRRTEA